MSSKATKTKTPAPNVPVPQSDEEAAQAIADVGRMQREIGRIEAGLNDDISQLQERAAAAVAPLKERLEQVTAGLQLYCTANRNRLTQEGKVKSAAFLTGTISWRFRPARVTLRGAKEVIIGVIKERKLLQFLRIAEDINKQAMLDNPALARTIPGVSVGSPGEDFIVEPAEIDVEEARP